MSKARSLAEISLNACDNFASLSFYVAENIKKQSMFWPSQGLRLDSAQIPSIFFNLVPRRALARVSHTQATDARVKITDLTGFSQDRPKTVCSCVTAHVQSPWLILVQVF